MPQVVETFRPHEVMRLYRRAGVRNVALGKRFTKKSERAAARWFGPAIVPALSASTVIVVEGYHDRLALNAVLHRAFDLGLVPSFPGAGISIIDAEGTGGLPKLAELARSLGLYVIALVDNDSDARADDDEAVRAARSAADITCRLPARTAIERLLMRGVSDDELVRAWGELDEVMGGLDMPRGWDAMTGEQLVTTLAKFLHKKSGALHSALVEILDPTELSPEAVATLKRLHEIATTRPSSDLVEL